MNALRTLSARTLKTRRRASTASALMGAALLLATVSLFAPLAAHATTQRIASTSTRTCFAELLNRSARIAEDGSWYLRTPRALGLLRVRLNCRDEDGTQVRASTDYFEFSTANDEVVHFQPEDYPPATNEGTGGSFDLFAAPWHSTPAISSSLARSARV